MRSGTRCPSALCHEAHQERHVRVAPQVIVEIGHLPVEVVFLQDHVAHGQRQRGVGALLGVQPDVGELGGLGIVGRDHGALRALVAHLGVEMGVRRARLRHVGAPHDDEAGIVPVGALRHVGLLAPGLRARPAAGRNTSRRTTGTRRRSARDSARPRHRRPWTWPGSARSRSRGPARACARCRRWRRPIRSRSPRPRWSARSRRGRGWRCRRRLRLGILDDRGPGGDRRQLRPRRAPQLQQPAADHRIFHPRAGIQVPAVGGAAGAAARLVVRQVGTRARIVRLLGFPGDDPALDVDLPRAGAGAVHAVGGAHDLVVLPALPVAVLPRAVLVGEDAVAVGERSDVSRRKKVRRSRKCDMCFLPPVTRPWPDGGCGAGCSRARCRWSRPPLRV